jgi:Mg-chelatase subunit ChlD
MAKKKSAKKKFTNLIIVDASGSMVTKIEEVKGGLRKLFLDIKSDAANNPTVLQTTIVTDFSSANDFRILANTDNAENLTDAIANNYQTRSATALYDAIAKSFQLIPENQDGVFVTIITDGEENDSKEFNTDHVKKLIADARLKKWALVFMCCDEASMLAAKNMGFAIANSVMVANTSAGISKSFNMSTNARSVYYTALSTDQKIDVDNLVTNP